MPCLAALLLSQSVEMFRPVHHPVPSSDNISALGLGDVDGDGRTDFVQSSSSSRWRVLIGDPGGAFHASGGAETDGVYFKDIELVDVDLDGDLDGFHGVFRAGWECGVVLNDGTGSFTPRPGAYALEYIGLAAGVTVYLQALHLGSRAQLTKRDRVTLAAL
ncbi:MAG: hypothetical protein AAF682_22000 [Planctomycetota bacterium]